MFIFMVHWLGAVKAVEEFKLLSMETMMMRKVPLAMEKQTMLPKKINELLKMQLRSLQTTTGQILLIMDMILVFHLCKFHLANF